MALTQACYSGNVELVKSLIENRAYVNYRRQPITALLAQSVVNEEIFFLLLNAGLDNNIVDLICSYRHFSLLQKFEFDINRRYENHDTPLTLLLKIVEPPLYAVKLLLEKGADVNSCDRYGNYPLHLAIKNSENVKLLIEAKACISLARRALNRACQHGYSDSIPYLISPSNVNILDRNNDIPLDSLIRSYAKVDLNLFLINGAEISDRALGIACNYGREDVAFDLLQYEIPYSRYIDLTKLSYRLRLAIIQKFPDIEYPEKLRLFDRKFTILLIRLHHILWLMLPIEVVEIIFEFI